MKQLLTIVFLAISAYAFCNNPVTEDKVTTIDGILYLKETNQPYSGTVNYLYDNGKIFSEDNYLEGKRNGLQIIYYKDGKLNGKWIDYHENGRIFKASDYLDGKLHGKIIVYGSDGRTLNQYNVRNGVEVK